MPIPYTHICAIPSSITSLPYPCSCSCSSTTVPANPQETSLSKSVGRENVSPPGSTHSSPPAVVKEKDVAEQQINEKDRAITEQRDHAGEAETSCVDARDARTGRPERDREQYDDAEEDKGRRPWEEDDKETMFSMT